MVNYPERHLFLSWGGSLYGTEIWVNTIRLNFAQEASAPALIDYATTNKQAVHDKLKTWFNANGALWTTAVRFQWSKFNGVERDGHYTDKDNANTIYESGAGAAGVQTPFLPPQIAIVGTWTTGAQRGLVHSGKIFLPCMQMTVAGPTDGRITVSQIQDAVTALKALADTLNGLPAGTQTTTAGSPKCSLISGVRAGQIRRITGVKVGLVADTMRSRRNRLVETYTAITPITS